MNKEYQLPDGITLDELLQIYIRLEETQYFKNVDYIVRVLADEYEDSMFAYNSANDILNDEEHKDIITSINMVGYPNPNNRDIYANVMASDRLDSILVRSHGDMGVFNTVESCLPQMKL